MQRVKYPLKSCNQFSGNILDFIFSVFLDCGFFLGLFLFGRWFWGQF